MKKLLLLAVAVAICAGCKPLARPICPEYYAQRVKFVGAQWRAGKITTTAATRRMDELDEQAAAWVDDHYVSDRQRLLLRQTHFPQ